MVQTAFAPICTRIRQKGNVWVLCVRLAAHVSKGCKSQIDERDILKAEGPESSLQKTTMLVLAVTLHNLPEGMAVGVVYAGCLSGDAKITATGALALSLGIAVQVPASFFRFF